MILEVISFNLYAAGFVEGGREGGGPERWRGKKGEWRRKGPMFR